MTKATLEPGKKNITPKGPEPLKENQHSREEKDFLPELGFKRPEKSKEKDDMASPVDPDIDLE